MKWQGVDFVWGCVCCGGGSWLPLGRVCERLMLLKLYWELHSELEDEIIIQEFTIVSLMCWQFQSFTPNLVYTQDWYYVHVTTSLKIKKQG